MVLRKTIHKTRNFFNKTFQNFKSFIFVRYKKLTKTPSLNLLSTNINNNNNPKMQHLDNFYNAFCEQWDPDGNNQKSQEKRVDIESNTNTNTNMINSKEERIPKKNNNSKRIEENEDVVGCSKNGQNRDVLEQKMKELEMMDMKDEEHVLDIEEVLHSYSLLTSPIYQDLVDKFFTDMYSEFFLPQPSKRSNSMNSSLRRLGPLNI